MSNRKWNRAYKTIGTVFVDLGKFTYGSLILGGLLKGDIDPFWVFLFGVISASLFFIVGTIFISQSED